MESSLPLTAACAGTGWQGVTSPGLGGLFPCSCLLALGFRGKGGIPTAGDGEGMGAEVSSQWICCPGQRWL